MYGRHKAVTISISATLIATTLIAGSATAQSGKEGGAVPPVALELAVTDLVGRGLVDTFAARVDALSGGQMRIDVDWVGGSDTAVPARVQAGEADLGWVGARGLHDLDALLTPFLVSDGRLLNAIIEGPIGADMLAGLADDGLEGLALLPGNQRFFVGIGRALASPADFEGAKIALARTPFTDRLIESLGAEPVEVGLDDRAGYEAQGIDGLLVVANNQALFPDTYMTANLVPFTVPLIIFGNTQALAELAPEQRDVLQAAALDVRKTMLEAWPEVESSAARCAVGASVIEATDADVLAIEAVTLPVRDELSDDAATAGFIERIEALKAELPAPAWPATCGAGAQLPVDAALTTIPDGTYRAVGTRQDSLRTGWESDCALELGDEHIVFVIEGGGASFTQLSACGDSPLEVGDHGTLEYSADGMVMRSTGIPGQATFAWSVEGETLTLRVLETVEEFAPLSVLRFLFEHEFVKSPS